MTDELKPCPFCGSGLTWRMEKSVKGDCIFCQGCGALVPTEYWNTRPIEDNMILEIAAGLRTIDTLLELLQSANSVCENIYQYIQNGEFFDPETTKLIEGWHKAQEIKREVQ